MSRANVMLAVVIWLLMLLAILANETASNLVGDVIFGVVGRQIYSALFAIVAIVLLTFYFRRLTGGARWGVRALCTSLIWILLTVGFSVVVLHNMIGWSWQVIVEHARFWEGGLLGLVLVSQLVVPSLLGVLTNNRN